jgi:hypothetical protein
MLADDLPMRMGRYTKVKIKYWGKTWDGTPLKGKGKTP